MSPSARVLTTLKAFKYAHDVGDNTAIEVGLKLIWQQLEPIMKANLSVFPPHCVLALSYYFYCGGDFGKAIKELLEKYTPSEDDTKFIDEAFAIFKEGIDYARKLEAFKI